MSRQYYNLPLSDDFFSHQALLASLRILRNNHPELANAVQHTISTVQLAPYETFKGMHTGEMHFNTEIYQSLSAHTIGKIVAAITELGQNAFENQHIPHEYITLLRGLIDDWVKLTEWILRHDSNFKQMTYH